MACSASLMGLMQAIVAGDEAIVRLLEQHCAR
jgi:hypothetical protein